MNECQDGELDRLALRCHRDPQDSRSWDLLLRRLHRLLSVFVAKHAPIHGNLADLADLLQDALMRVHSGFPRTEFRGYASLQSYAMRVARNLLIDLHRRGKTRAVHEMSTLLPDEAEPQADPLEVLLAREETRMRHLRARLAARAIVTLEQPCRDRLSSWLIEGMTPAAYARAHGIPVSHIYVLLRRCLERLRRRISELDKPARSSRDEL